MDKLEAIGSPSYTKRILRQYGLNMKKSLGQNFLMDQNILRNIVAAAELTQEKAALEIGPGIGALTEVLAQKAGKVVALEIDQRLLPILGQTLAPYPQAKVLHQDVLKADLHQLFREEFATWGKVSVVANLPYYITTPIIMKLLEAKLPLEHIVVMLQKEVAERMTAKPGSKNYGSLSIAIQYYCETELVATVPKTVFVPQPNVDSAVMKLTMRNAPAVEVSDVDLYFEVVQSSFAQRRKTIANNLAQRFFGKDNKEQLLAILESSGIEPSRRGETLTMEEFAGLTEQLKPFITSR
ncbi:16S rRNA (adenine(1518)-N(6)/adenine(1519)-N(6))-dimethyltransferase RsmA [Marinicrinis sediminis]|uniref:Ribosomal RNA small subunit methyltransferase A n=1 Tax=Marinicrinis sediminis TaxID=1652465 RepID=A0ABW5R909_9BACL